MKKGFTLAEIMIVLTIIGILTAILLPIANHSRPDENVMKFKKADTTLKNVIRELVNSDKYYADGDLSMRKLSNGTSQQIDGTHNGDVTYFCESMADILSAKKVKCSSYKNSGNIGSLSVSNSTSFREKYSYVSGQGEESLSWIDDSCKSAVTNVGEEIVASDGIVFYQVNPYATFGVSVLNLRDSNGTSNENCPGEDGRTGCSKQVWFKHVLDDQGFYIIYKMYCVDIDGAGKGEDPFGYAIRVDGKVVAGKRANEWLEKGFQKGANDN